MNSHEEQSRTIVVDYETGMHARPSASFVKVATQFQSEIFVEKDGERVNGKSIIGLLMLAVADKSKIDITAVGPDAKKALDTLEALVKNGFNLPSQLPPFAKLPPCQIRHDTQTPEYSLQIEFQMFSVMPTKFPFSYVPIRGSYRTSEMHPGMSSIEVPVRHTV